MKQKIILLPLDERPCNYEFPFEIFSHEDIEIVRPEVLGNKKKPADIQQILEFLEKECKNADGLILSVDMLLYGGLVPSRIHEKSVEEFEKIANTISKLKTDNERLRIFAFQVIMRCPDYSSSDEEPDYYEQYGASIHKIGEAIHKSRLGMSGEEELDKLLDQVDGECLQDYVARRQTNQTMNQFVIDLVNAGIIDALVIPQDDSAVYGYAAMDQENVRRKISKENLTDSILMYPGADEVGMTLLSRMVNQIHARKPRVYVKYACEKAKDLIPLYEGCSLAGTIKNHILSAGCRLTDTCEQADLILVVTAPAGHMEEAEDQPSQNPEYYAERSLPELIDFMKDMIKQGKLVTVADNAYANGSDIEFLRMMDKNQLLTQVAGYAGWNTSANTIGTALAEGINALYYGMDDNHKQFLIKRYIEDAGFCSVVRKSVSGRLKEYGMNYFDVHEKNGKAAELVKSELNQFLEKYLPSVADEVQIHKVYMPWSRMFEIGLEVRFNAHSL